MRFTVQRWIPCPPELAFVLATHPEPMNRWSEARIEAVDAGEGGHVASIGATRFVHLPDSLLTRGTRLEEVVVESRPPHRFVYRVVGGAPLEWHEGVQELQARVDPRGSGTPGTWLRWHVDARLDLPVPGADALVRQQLEAGLRRSLEAMVTAATEGVPAEPLARWRRPPEEPDRDALRREAEQAEADLRAIHRQRRGDPRAVFAGLFAEVMREILATAEAGAYTHPGWLYRLLPLFRRYYADALDAEDAGRPVEAHWREAFRDSERAFRTRPHLEATSRASSRQLRAHLEEDLPRALATTYADHYADPYADHHPDHDARRHGFARFRADHLTLQRVFAPAAERFVAKLPPDAWPWRQRLARRTLPAAVRARMARPSRRWLPQVRRQAFDRGERLAAMLVGAVRA